jgi:hypothetical protein
MIKYIQLILLLLFLSCTKPTNGVQQDAVSVNKTPLNKNTSYKKIRDHLYQDSEGRLYFKSKAKKHFETGKWVTVWIKYVHCDTCWTSTENEIIEHKELKDFVDVATWKYDTSNGYWTEYVDKNHRYHHTPMADGGVLSLLPK